MGTQPVSNPLPTLAPAAPAQWPAITLAILVFAALSAAAAITSAGFLEGDACTHYLYARFAFHEPHLMTNVWGRPFCTLIYALPAVLAKRLGVRLASMLIMIGVGLICCRIARRQGLRWPALALIFLLGQPLLFLHSFSELTELPFALLMALALWAYQARRWLPLAIIVGIMPTSRPEGFLFLGLAALALLLHRRWWWIPLLILPLAIWSYAGYHQFGPDQPYPWYQWLPRQWPYSTRSKYDPGSILQFIGGLPAVVSPGAFPAVLLGIWLALRRRTDSPSCPDHRLRCQLIIAILPLMVLLGHSFLYWRGLMASNGELRYMLVVSPMWALLAASGWEWTFTRLGWRYPLRWAGLAMLVPLAVNVAYRVVPLKLGEEGVRAQQAATWYQQSRWRDSYPRLIATDRQIYYFLDLSPTNGERSADYSRKAFAANRRGILLIWDPTYGAHDADAARSIPAADIRAAGWVPVHVFATPSDNSGGLIARMARAVQRNRLTDWVVFLSPLDNQGNPTPREWEVPLPAFFPGR